MGMFEAERHNSYSVFQQEVLRANFSQRDSPGLSKISQSDQSICSSWLCFLRVLYLWVLHSWPQFFTPHLSMPFALQFVFLSMKCGMYFPGPGCWTVMRLTLANGMWIEVTGPGLKKPCLFCSPHFS